MAIFLFFKISFTTTGTRFFEVGFPSCVRVIIYVLMRVCACGVCSCACRTFVCPGVCVIFCDIFY